GCYCSVSWLFTFLGLASLAACITLRRSDLLMVPVRVTSPLAMVAVTPVMPAALSDESTLDFRMSSGLMVTGGGGGGVSMTLFTTDLTPLTLFAASSAVVLAASSITSPLRVATPPFTSAITPGAAVASLSFTSFWSFASLGLQAYSNTPIPRRR